MWNSRLRYRYAALIIKHLMWEWFLVYYEHIEPWITPVWFIRGSIESKIYCRVNVALFWISEYLMNCSSINLTWSQKMILKRHLNFFFWGKMQRFLGYCQPKAWVICITHTFFIKEGFHVETFDQKKCLSISVWFLYVFCAIPR